MLDIRAAKEHVPDSNELYELYKTCSLLENKVLV